MPTLGIPEEVIDRVAGEEERELVRRERDYRDGRTPIDVQGRTVILVDDGLATGSSMRVAVRALQEEETSRNRNRRASGCPHDLR